MIRKRNILLHDSSNSIDAFKSAKTFMKSFTLRDNPKNCHF